MPDCGLENKSVTVLVNERRARDRQRERQTDRQTHSAPFLLKKDQENHDLLGSA